MTPTPMPRNWDRAENALAGVTAFADVDQTIDAATARLPANSAEARNVTKLAPGVEAEAGRRLAEARELRELSAVMVRAAAEMRTDARRDRRRLAWRVRRLRARRIVRPVWRLLTAVPRLLWWLAERPFRRG